MREGLELAVPSFIVHWLCTHPKIWFFPSTVGAGIAVGSKQHIRYDGKGPGDVVSFLTLRGYFILS